jgi:hypothetical protein
MAMAENHARPGFHLQGLQSRELRLGEGANVLLAEVSVSNRLL